MKVRNVPCLCPPCISEQGCCYNHAHVDDWRTIKLIPQKGANLKKYKKRKQPDTGISQKCVQEEVAAQESDDELPEITFEEPESAKIVQKSVTETVTDDVTEKPTDKDPKQW